MTILSQIDALRNSLTNAYNTIDTKGGDVPLNKNAVNLANAINTIPSGGGGGITASKYGAIYKKAGNQIVATTTQVQECDPRIVDWNKAYMAYWDASDPAYPSDMGVQFTYGENYEQGGYGWSVNIMPSGEVRWFTNEEMLSQNGISVTGVEGTWCAFNLAISTVGGNDLPLAKIEFASASDFETYTAYNIQNDYNVYYVPLGNGCWVDINSITGIEIGSNITSVPTRAFSRVTQLNYIDLSGAMSLQNNSLQPNFVTGAGGQNRTFKVGSISASVATSGALNGLTGRWPCYGENRAEWIAKFPTKLSDGGK